MEKRGQQFVFSQYEQDKTGLPPHIEIDDALDTIYELLKQAEACDDRLIEARSDPIRGRSNNTGTLILRASCMRQTAKGLEQRLLG